MKRHPHNPVFAEPTPRQLEVLRLAMRGLTNTAIAERLVVEKTTVRGHITRLRTKYYGDRGDRYDRWLARAAYELGRIDEREGRGCDED